MNTNVAVGIWMLQLMGFFFVNGPKNISCFIILIEKKTFLALFCMLASSGVDHEFDRWSGQTKDYKIGIFFFPLSF
jgi:hypothetical protein